MQNPLFQYHLSVTDSSAANVRCGPNYCHFLVQAAWCAKELGLVSQNSAAQLLANSVMVKTLSF